MKLTGKLDSRSGIYEITPDQAKALLEIPAVRNRPIRNGVVLKYARRMQKGMWRMTGEPIILDKHGAPQDGFHRLTSCVLSGKPIQTVILFGNFDFMSTNQGSSRSGGDALDLAIPNIKHRLGVSSVAQMCIKHERALSREASMYTKTHHLTNPKEHWSDIDNFEIVQWVKKHQEVPELYSKAMSLGRPSTARKSLIPLSPATAGWFLALSVASSDTVNPWFEGLLSGAGIERGDIRLLLRQAMQNRLVSSNEFRPSGIEALHWIAKAWRDRKATNLRIFSVKSTEEFPFFR